MELQLPKGTRDFPPEEQLLRDEVVGTLKEVFERYGFAPLDTPAFERFDVLGAKYAGGEEILKETFRFTDQGGRELALRYDLTVPLARFVGMNPQLKLPFKRYQVGRVFRDGPIKLGRYREFYQCDCDVVGASSVLADAECVRLGVAAFRALGLPVVYRVNSRKVLEALLAKGGVPAEKAVDAMLTLDKLEKVPLEDVKKELAGKGIPESAVEFLLSLEGANAEKLARVKEYLGEDPAIAEFEEFLSYLDGVENVVYDAALSRGLAYYTGTVFEAFAVDGPVKSSLSGGGRYDTMVGGLLGKEGVPAVGVSFGLEPILETLRATREQTRRSVVRVYVAPIKATAAALRITEELRAAGVNAELDLKGRSISKNLDYANGKGVPFVLIVGQKEVDEGVVKVRDMSSGNEETLPVAGVVARFQ